MKFKKTRRSSPKCIFKSKFLYFMLLYCLVSRAIGTNGLRTAAGRFHRTPTFKMSLCHREFKINYANVQQFLCATARLNVYHVCMGGAALSAGGCALLCAGFYVRLFLLFGRVIQY